MSTRVIDGAYTQLISRVPSNASARFGAIGIVGHMASGIKTGADGTETVYSGSNLAGSGTWQTFDASLSGLIYEFDSFDQVVNKFGSIPEVSFTSGTFSGTGIDSSPYDNQYNLIRALELIYLANPSVRTYVGVLDGSGTTAKDGASSAGVSLVLAELIKYDDISFVVGAGMDFSATFQTHVTSASSEVNQSERVYVGGTSLGAIFTSGTKSPDLDGTDGEDWSALLDDTGRSVFYATSVNYKYQSDFKTAPSTGYEIGGNQLAAYLAGYLTSIPEQRSLLRQGTKFGQKYMGSNFRWSRAHQTTLVNGAIIHSKTAGGRTTYSRALTYASTSSAFRRITTRRIVDRVIKEIRATSNTYVGKDNTEIVRIGIKSSCDSKLSALSRFGLIQSGANSTVWVEGNDVADGVVRVASLFKPITEIEFIEIQLTVEL